MSEINSNHTQNTCDTASCGHTTAATQLNPGLSRRKALKAAAVLLASVGLTSQSQGAFAAASQVKAGKASAVPVKGAKAYTLNGKYILVTQPKAGVFKAFSGLCTHQGAQISGIQGTNLVCTVHGSMFDTTTGAVKSGPAPTGLSKFTVTNKAGTLYISM